MHRDEIESKWSLAFCVEQGSCDMLMDRKRLCQDCRDEYFRAKGALSRAGLTIIPAVPTEAETERVRKALIKAHTDGKSVAGCDMARAAASAVREGQAK